MEEVKSSGRRPYDIFISYAREDAQRVRGTLYEPLLKCRLKREQRRPRIFLDEAPEGIRFGANYVEELCEALVTCERFIAAFTETYLTKEPCLWELNQAFRRDMMARRRLILPVLLDPLPRSRIPFAVQAIQTIDIRHEDWFVRLCAELELERFERVAALRFLNEPPTRVVVNHTLPAVRVEVTGRGEYHEEFEISLSGERCRLQGTTRATTRDGVVTFADLSVGEEAGEACLIAETAGLAPARSERFAVVSPVIADHGPPQIATAGEPVFFADGKALAILGYGRVQVCDLAGKPLGKAWQCPGLVHPRKLLARDGDLIAVATWLGGLELIARDGRHLSWQFSESGHGFRIPGAVTFSGDGVYIGFWDGDIYRSGGSGGEPVKVLRHEGGVQALAVAGERHYVCGFDGNLGAYAGGRRVNGTALESTVHLLRGDAERLVAAGDQKLYQISLPRLNVLSEPLPIARVASVLVDTAFPVVMDHTGAGFRFDSELAIRSEFCTSPGSYPVSADDRGQYCVVRHPDESCSLLAGNRIVFSTRRAALAVAPDGRAFAFADQAGVRVLSEESLGHIIAESRRDE